MNRDIFIRNLIHEKIVMSPRGRNANELTIEEFEKDYEKFFGMIFEIATTDIFSEVGYGEFDENNKALYGSVHYDIVLKKENKNENNTKNDQFFIGKCKSINCISNKKRDFAKY